jgi:hypothetical protein
VKYPPEPKKSNKRKLPKDRHIIPKDTNFKVNSIPAGCIDFEMFLRIFDYKYNHLWSNEEIADEFDLDVKNIDDLLFYFKPFNNKIFDKKMYVTAQRFMYDKSYVKIAQLLNRDVETFKEVPEYQRELKKIEDQKALDVLIETAENDGRDIDEIKEEELQKLADMKFKHEKFYLGSKEEESSRSDEGKIEEANQDDNLKDKKDLKM